MFIPPFAKCAKDGAPERLGNRDELLLPTDLYVELVRSMCDNVVLLGSLYSVDRHTSGHLSLTRGARWHNSQADKETREMNAYWHASISLSSFQRDSISSNHVSYVDWHMLNVFGYGFLLELFGPVFGGGVGFGGGVEVAGDRPR